MFEIFSSLLKYIFIFIIYLFIYGIIRLIYLDIKSMNALKNGAKKGTSYLKLINVRERLDFKVDESYILDRNLLIGRSKDSDIVIRDPYISGKHVQITMHEGRYFLMDMGSTNGTFINGEQLVKNTEVCLKDGDKVHMGQLDFLFVNGSNEVI